MCFTYLFIFIYLLVYLFVICILLAKLFIYLFTFNDPSQESSYLKEVGFLGRRRSIMYLISCEADKSKCHVQENPPISPVLDIKTYQGIRRNCSYPITNYILSYPCLQSHLQDLCSPQFKSKKTCIPSMSTHSTKETFSTILVLPPPPQFTTTGINYRISWNNSRPSINRLPRIIAPPLTKIFKIIASLE